VSRAKTQRPKARAATRRPAPTPAPVSAEDEVDFTDPIERIELDPVPQFLEERRVPQRRGSSGAARAISVGETVGEDQVLEVAELADVRSLSILVHDASTHLPSAQGAIVAAGHLVIGGASGKDGLEKIRHLMRDDTDVLVVGIPGGEPLIDAALALAPRRPVIVAACTGTAVDAAERAVAAGADLVTIRPHELERIAPVLLAASRLLDERSMTTNARGSEAVLRARLDALIEPEVGSLQPFELFQRVLELELKRARRYDYSIAVALFAVEIDPPEPPPGVRGILRARAGNALIHSIRDIDLATELDLERFLVLLPYTDLSGAAEVARRILHAVAAVDPVIAAGHSYPPRVIGAVAGAAPGQPLSFARLMRDATRALEQARHDGASLAVPIEPGQ
jgi:hypothetical protein